MLRPFIVCCSLAGFLPLQGADAPDDVVGRFLYFEEGLEDYLVFLDESTGEERDINGDVDPMTYTYSITGPQTAEIVVTRDVDRYDEWTITWTGPGTGTFVREEFRDSNLEDTDTGGFVESSGSSIPPVDLVGVRLEEAIEGEDERFEFLTDTEGREFEPGDIDPFTYTYSLLDPVTALIVATYGTGRYDDLALTFETETTGTYLLGRVRDGNLVKEKRGQFRLDLNTQTVDLLIGDDKGGLRGQNFFNLNGTSQTVKTRLSDDRAERLRGEIENDGDDDTISARASRGSRKVKTRVFSLNPRRNVTASVTGPGASLGEVGHNASERFEIEVRRKGRGRGKGTGWLQGSSDGIPGAADRVYYNIVLP